MTTLGEAIKVWEDSKDLLNCCLLFSSFYSPIITCNIATVHICIRLHDAL